MDIQCPNKTFYLEQHSHTFLPRVQDKHKDNSAVAQHHHNKIHKKTLIAMLGKYLLLGTTPIMTYAAVGKPLSVLLLVGGGVGLRVEAMIEV